MLARRVAQRLCAARRACGARTASGARRVLARGATNAAAAPGSEGPVSLHRVRNIGIIAHIDAGKTTTTERLLFYSGVIRSMGNVDHGNTVTDFLKEERERGISIQAACAHLPWRGARINLIDTPGHVDFTVEVERSLRVLDGAVAVIDAVAGVQAQTETVWRQADRYRVPRVVFVNKMDRDGASLERSVQSLRTRLGARPLVAQLPLGREQDFEGVLDLCELLDMRWRDALGLRPEVAPVDASHPLRLQAIMARAALIEQLAEMDEATGEAFLAVGDSDDPEALNSAFTPAALRAALRRATLHSKGLVVLCGSSLRNKAVQPLMDAVIEFLPSPLDRPPVVAFPLGWRRDADDAESDSARERARALLAKRRADRRDPLCALAFKVVRDSHRGPLVFVRVFSGVLEARTQLVAVSGRTPREAALKPERPMRLLEVLADSATELKAIEAGHIGAVAGLKHVRTGDTLLAAQDKERVFIEGVQIPDPVFYCSVEPDSAAQQGALEEALRFVALEDPSVQVELNKDTGQTVVKGMGELHLEIVQKKLVDEYRVPCRFGRMRIAYREGIARAAAIDHRFVSEPKSGRRESARVALEVQPAEAEAPIVEFAGSPVAAEPQIGRKRGRADASAAAPPPPPPHAAEGLSQQMRDAVLDGVRDALMCGPLLSFPLARLRVEVTACEAHADSTPEAFRSCAAQAVAHALAAAEPVLLEPVMDLEVAVDPAFVGEVLSDLTSRRRAEVLGVEGAAADGAEGAAYRTSTVRAVVPLASLVGYATALRSRTKGKAALQMEFKEYRRVGKQVLAELLANPP